MKSFIWAMVGALAFVLAYGYYLFAGTLSLPGAEAIVVLIEFGTVMATLILFTVVVGVCLMPPSGDRRPHDREGD